MVFIGWLMMVVGIVLFFVSLGMTLRANPHTHVPYNRNPPVVPRYAVPMRSVSAGLFVFAAVFLGSVTGYWVVVIPVAAVLVTAACVLIHNRAVAGGES